MTTAQMVMQGSTREMALRLVGMCGSPSEAIGTLMDGASGLFGRPTGRLATRLAAITEEIAAMKRDNTDAYKLIYYGKTRKGGSPNVKRFL